MNGQINFDCHDFFDNTNLCILEISVSDGITNNKQYQWLLINKADLSIKQMSLKNMDGSTSVQERFFDLGFLKYNSESGVFIEHLPKKPISCSIRVATIFLQTSYPQSANTW